MNNYKPTEKVIFVRPDEFEGGLNLLSFKLNLFSDYILISKISAIIINGIV